MTVPCAVCHSANSSSVVMVPSKVNCSKEWRREYYGYLVSDHIYRSVNACVDVALEVLPSSGRNQLAAAALFHVEAKCDSMSCPPYDGEKELMRVVCSR